MKAYENIGKEKKANPVQARGATGEPSASAANCLSAAQ